LICAQGGEGGGHTGDVATSVLIPAVVDICKGHKSPLTGQPIYVIAAGGIYDGRGLAMSLTLGAQAVWVGTRFVCAKEAGATPHHQKSIIGAGYDSTVRTIIFTGRPMRVLKNSYIDGWESRPDEIKRLVAQGVIPVPNEMEELSKSGKDIDPKTMMLARPLLMGQVAASIQDVLPAKDIVDQMVHGAVETLKANAGKISVVSKL
jgi:NAD(P)H-dependent flavin oxidoreductase YrpB (nitropropane dioxygenase family)